LHDLVAVERLFGEQRKDRCAHIPAFGPGPPEEVPRETIEGWKRRRSAARTACASESPESEGATTLVLAVPGRTKVVGRISLGKP
jgi:hypothetical protein